MKVSLRSILLLATVGVVAALTIACSDDDPVTTGKDCSSCVQPLTQKSNVLIDIEVAYNQRRADLYDALLDADFTFSYTDGDVGGGTPVQWDRATEADIHSRLLDKNASESLLLDLDLDAVTWTASAALGAPAETWYTTTVLYRYTFDLGTTTYITGGGSKATFTVRNAGTDAAPHWQLVEMEDLGFPIGEMSSASLTQPSTWGRFKALYR
jgi:hypothetical protein